MPRTASELVAEARRQVNTCSSAEAPAWIQKNPAGRLIDVREPGEHAAGSLNGAVNIPRGVVEFQIGNACEADTPILLFCASGGRAALAAAALKELGYANVTAVSGSIADLIQATSEL